LSCRSAVDQARKLCSTTQRGCDSACDCAKYADPACGPR
jgi:hypothetical protein